MRQARIAQSDPSARVGGELPARLPFWERDERARPTELQGLRAAYEALEARVETGLTEFSPPALRRVAAEMRAEADYAAIWHRNAGPVERGEARGHLLEALQHAFTLGQLLALPTLAEIERVRQDREDGLPLGRHASWLQIGPGWPVLDSEGETIGLIYRVCGDRATGRFDGVDVSHGVGSSGLHVPAEAILEIGAGRLRLSVPEAALS